MTNPSPSAAALALWQTLRADGAAAEVISPGADLEELQSFDRSFDLLLVDAALEVDPVRRLVHRIAGTLPRPPAMVAFNSGDIGQMERHLQEGFDYLVEPFLPHLVRRRLEVCRQSHRLAHVVDEMTATVHETTFERELQIGREIQRGFLPEHLPVLDDWDIAAHFEPAREVSGDFYDAYDVINGNYLAFAIADVCDKGIGAALFMALIRSLLRQAAVAGEPTRGSERPPGGALALRAVQTTNNYLTTNHLHQAYFATLFFGVVDTRTGDLIYINCGHNAPIVRHGNGEWTELLPTGPALGIMKEARFDLGSLTIAPGDLLYLYTDGVPEAKNASGEFLGEERMHAVLAEPGPASAVVERMRALVAEHTGAGDQFDDITMLGLYRHPSGGGQA